MKIPLLDLKPQTKEFRKEIIDAVTRVIDSTQYILGPEVSLLEQSVADYCGVPYAVGVSSGTDALLVSLMGLGIGPGDYVLTSPYTFFATMGSILRVGALPVFADIEADSMNIDPAYMADLLEKDRKNGSRIKALMPVHLFGQCAEMASIMELANEYGVQVIEDAAQAIGSDFPFQADGKKRWKRAGSMGNAGCFSFFPSKNLGGIGDGGMVVTSDEQFAEKLRSLRNHGAQPKYYHSIVGGNFRLDPIQACVLSIKIHHLDKWHRARYRNSQLYRELFADAGLIGDYVTLPPEKFKQAEGAENNNHHIYNQFVIRVQQRDRLRDYLSLNNIGCEVYYPLCLHQQECLKPYGLAGGSFSVAEQAANETLALPIYPELQLSHLEYIVETIRKFFQL